ncbi:MAG: globin domain-containing protein [Actinomycetota bacterium]
MTDQQILLVQQSFAALAPDAEIIADIFYNRLFALEPKLELMFPADLIEQKRKLMTTLEFAVESLEKMDRLTPALEALGRKHAGYGVRDAHYHIVGEALLETLGEYLGKRFTANTRAAWAMMFFVVANVMKRAARNVQTPVFA